MSGLLHRLARQAAGRAEPVIHPLARMRYVAPLCLLEPDAVPHADPRPAPPEGVRGTEPRSRPTAPTGGAPGGTPAVAGGERPEPPGRRPPEPAAPGEGHTGVPAPRHPHPRAGVDSEHRLSFPEDQVFAEIAALAGRVAAPREDARGGVAAAGPGLAPGRTDPAAPSLPGARMPPSPPAPLVRAVGGERPGSPRESRRSRLGPASPAQGQPPGQAPEPTEVHVHIGRIEVTAVHEPAPPKRGRKPTPQPVSLDEYLARRGGSSA